MKLSASKKIIYSALIISAAALLSQAGFAAAGSVTVKNTAAILFVSAFAYVIINSLFTLAELNSKGWIYTIAAVFAILCCCTAAESLSFPLASASEPDVLRFRYPSLAYIIFAEIAGLLLISGRRRLFYACLADFAVTALGAALCFALSFKYNSIIYWISIALAVILFIISILKPYTLHLTPHTSHLKPDISHACALILVAGLVLCFAYPVCCYVSFDDETHYRRTVDLSQGLYVTLTEGDVRTIYDPLCSFDSSSRSELKERIEEQDTTGDLYYDGVSSALNPDKIGYFPLAAGRWLGQVLRLNFNGRFILGRIFNLLVYTAVVFLAIRRLKSGKLALFLLCASPGMISSASNYTYDAWVTGFIYLSMAYYVGTLQRGDEKLTLSEEIIMLLAGVLGVLPKAPYAVMLIILLFIPKEKFRDSHQRRRWIAAVIIAGLLIFVYTYMNSFAVEDPADNRLGSDFAEVSAIGQIKYILANPKTYLLTLLSFTAQFIAPASASGTLTLFGYIGQVPGKYFLLILIYFASLAENTGRSTNLLVKKPYIRLIDAFILLIMAMVLPTIMYLVFTPVGYPYIMGCQFRYMMPLLFPFFGIVLVNLIPVALSERFQHAVSYVLIATEAVFVFVSMYNMVLSQCI